jgi:hypothetical protein
MMSWYWTTCPVGLLAYDLVSRYAFPEKKLIVEDEDADIYEKTDTVEDPSMVN